MLAAMTPSILSSVSRHSLNVRSQAILCIEHKGNVDIAPAGKDDGDSGSSSSSMSTSTVRELAPLS